MARYMTAFESCRKSSAGRLKRIEEKEGLQAKLIAKVNPLIHGRKCPKTARQR